MNATEEVINGINEENHQPTLEQISHAFLSLYYTALCKKQANVMKFFGDTAHFKLDLNPALQGQTIIQHEMERLHCENCKVRIHTTSAAPTSKEGFVLQVFGEFSAAEAVGRRFIQVFVLNSQSPKSYYVQTSLFQWLSTAFKDVDVTTEQNPSDAQDIVGSGNLVKECITNDKNIETNGHISPVVITGSLNELDLCADVQVAEEQKIDKMEEEMASTNGEDIQNSPKALNINETLDKSNETEQTAVVEAPKSWAKLVSGNSSYNGLSSKKSAAVAVSLARSDSCSTPLEDSANNSGKENYANKQEYGFRLYLGGLLKRTTPANITIVENEIKAAFEVFGPVVSVTVPRRVLENVDPHARAFAVIIMKTKEGMKNAFASARKDRNLYYITLRINSLGFYGEATLSELKLNYIPNRPLYYRNASSQGNMRGAYQSRNGFTGMSRGGSNTGRNGSCRNGLYPRNFSGGSLNNDYRSYDVHGRN